VRELSIKAAQASSTLSTLGATVASNYSQASSTFSSLISTVSGNYLEASSSIATLNSLIVGNTASLQSQINSITNVLNIGSGTTSAITVSSLGVVGIGNNAVALGDEKLRVSGRVRATGFDIDAAADLAENFEAVEAVDAGTVVAFSTSTTEWSTTNSSSSDDIFTISTVRKAREAHEAVGVVSTNPGIVLGKNILNGVPVAFSGRIPVKVTNEGGEIKRGDYLTVSATMPGYAMKLVGEGRSIGRALSDHESGRDKVLMLVENGLQKLDLSGNATTTTSMLTVGNIDLNANGVAITNIKSLASANGTWSIDENGRIVAKMICLEDLCIDKNTLTNVLQISGQKGVVLGESTTTVPGTGTTTEETVGPSATSTNETATSTVTTDESTIGSSTPVVPITNEVPPDIIPAESPTVDNPPLLDVPVDQPSP
jgi:hypothetical protein